MNIVKGILSFAVVSAVVATTVIVPAAVNADVNVDQDNRDTGFRSRNTNRFRLKRDYSMTKTNIGTATNTTSVTGNTGGNDQEENTSAGDQESGKVDVDADVFNNLNPPSEDPVVEPEHETVMVQQLNQDTGARSRNHNRASIRDTWNTSTTNVATATNTVGVVGNTGNNDQNKNTDAGNQTSGDVMVEVLFENVLN